MRLAALWVAGLGLALSGCGSQPGPPHLVLIVVDTLRADHLGAWGYDRPTSPFLDSLADRGVRFSHAFAPSSWTKPSVGSLFTSLLPSEHGAVSFADNLSPQAPLLATRLREAGYRTIGISGNFVHVNETAGFARGFDVWRTLAQRLEGPEGALLTLGEGEHALYLRAQPAERVNEAVFTALPAPEDGPVFLYVHYMEPHADYAPPEPMRRAFARDPAAHAAGPPATSDYVVDLAAGRRSIDDREHERLVDLYDAEVATVDRAIGSLVEGLVERGFRDAVLVVVSDHGEEFGDHDGWFHGVTLYGESLHVPMLFRDLRRPGPGTQHDRPVDLLDVPTTLLSLAGATPAPGMRGRDLLATGFPTRELVAELHPDPLFERKVRPRVQRLALLRWPWKVILRDGAAPLVYDLARDPAEARSADLHGAGPPPDLVADARARQSDLGRSAPSTPPTPLDAAARQRLRALGYAD